MFTYGTELRVTAELREAGTDRLGNCWLDVVGDESGQLARYGDVLVRPGPWPEGIPRIKPGSEEWLNERDTRRREAYRVEDPRQRAERLAQIDSYYGRPTTSTTVKTFRYPESPSALEYE